MMCGLVAGLLLMMWAFPDVPLTRGLHKILVEQPVRALARLQRHHLLHAVILTVMMFSFWEVIAVFGSAELIMAYAFDVALYVDAVIVTSAAAAAAYVKGAARALRRGVAASLIRVLPIRRPKVRARRSSPGRTHNAPANDDDRREQLLFAA